MFTRTKEDKRVYKQIKEDEMCLYKIKIKSVYKLKDDERCL